MKRFAIILTVLAVVLLLFSCSRTWVNKREDVSLHFVYGDINIHVALSGEEAERVIRILDGNIYEPPIGMPSCGFDEEICLKVGDQTFAVACDGCNGFAHVNRFRFLMFPWMISRISIPCLRNTVDSSPVYNQENAPVIY